MFPTFMFLWVIFSKLIDIWTWPSRWSPFLYQIYFSTLYVNKYARPSFTCPRIISQLPFFLFLLLQSSAATLQKAHYIPTQQAQTPFLRPSIASLAFSAHIGMHKLVEMCGKWYKLEWEIIFQEQKSQWDGWVDILREAKSLKR